MHKKSLYIPALIILIAIIALVIYFSFFGAQREAYEGILVWEGSCI